VKNFLTIFILTVYSSSSFGLAINFHYCGGRLTNNSIINLEGGKKCTCKAENKPSDCCENSFLYQKAENHETVQVLCNMQAENSFIGFSRYNQSVEKDLGNEPIGNLYDSFLLWKPCPVFLLNKVIRI
jgi:hypothetical protein